MSFRLKNASYIYRGRSPRGADERVHGIIVDDLEISSTGVTAIIGHSGSGKTTLLSLLAGFLSPSIGQGGVFTFEGRDISGAGLKAGQVSFVFQNPMLLGTGSGLLNILQGQVARSPDHEDPPFGLSRLQKALRQLGLQSPNESLVGKKAGDLSGGQAQRIAIIRALSMNPRAILCDEPTSSLDERTANCAMEALRAWADETGRPVLWVTHNLEQAARFADHFIFVANGRVVELSEEQRFALELDLTEETADGLPPYNQTDISERLAVLRDISEDIGPIAADAALEQEELSDGPQIVPSRMRFASWISNALSYGDAKASRGGSEDFPHFAPPSLRRLLTLVSGRPVPKNGSLQFIRRLLAYSRYSFGFVLCILLAQIATVDGFGRLAQDYSREQLEDPSVARIVFEYIIPDSPDDPDAAEQLFGDSTIPTLKAKISDALKQQFGVEADTDRVSVFGRRSVSGSSIRFRAPETRCNRWLDIQTTALNVGDPLVGQVHLEPSEGRAGLLESPGDVISQARLDSTNYDAPRGVALIDKFYVDTLIERCGHFPGDPIKVEWAAGQGGRSAPIELEILAAVADMPPLYPSQAELIVFEHDFQRAVALQTGFEPSPFKIATAYFPINGFQLARNVIKDGNYRVRDDSAAAVETLQKISSLSNTLPPVIIWVSLFGCGILILLVINNLLELNKRVLALFIAHGAKFFDILVSIVLHLVPAFVFAVLFVLAYGSAALWFFAPSLPPGLDRAWQYAAEGFLVSLLKLGAVTAVLLTGAVLMWWRSTRKQLKKYLQE